jgi:hypothetical protein
MTSGLDNRNMLSGTDLGALSCDPLSGNISRIKDTINKEPTLTLGMLLGDLKRRGIGKPSGVGFGAKFQVKEAAKKVHKAGIGMAGIISDEQKYSYPYYEMTGLEALDSFFKRCNKARNEVQRYKDTMETKKESFLKNCHIPTPEGGTIANCIEGMLYLFMGNAAKIEDVKLTIIKESPFLKVSPPPSVQNGDAIT